MMRSFVFDCIRLISYLPEADILQRKLLCYITRRNFR